MGLIDEHDDNRGMPFVYTEADPNHPWDPHEPILMAPQHGTCVVKVHHTADRLHEDVRLRSRMSKRALSSSITSRFILDPKPAVNLNLGRAVSDVLAWRASTGSARLPQREGSHKAPTGLPLLANRKRPFKPHIHVSFRGGRPLLTRLRYGDRPVSR